SEEYRLPLLLPNISPHILRHTFASRVVESNIIPPKHLQTILGHSNIQITMNVYAGISDEVLKNFVTKFEKSGIINIEV
ncbi:MAG: tyrosine-type recombinase/integrase, partial [Oscillospiraceae bacterium]|nr:tyrosine-type recombinase/integrase [Oscillospiraceae bacterium]